MLRGGQASMAAAQRKGMEVAPHKQMRNFFALKTKIIHTDELIGRFKQKVGECEALKKQLKEAQARVVALEQAMAGLRVELQATHEENKQLHMSVACSGRELERVSNQLASSDQLVQQLMAQVTQRTENESEALRKERDELREDKERWVKRYQKLRREFDAYKVSSSGPSLLPAMVAGLPSDSEVNCKSSSTSPDSGLSFWSSSTSPDCGIILESSNTSPDSGVTFELSSPATVNGVGLELAVDEDMGLSCSETSSDCSELSLSGVDELADLLATGTGEVGSVGGEPLAPGDCGMEECLPSGDSLGKSEEGQSCDDCCVVGESLLSAGCAVEQHLPFGDCSVVGRGKSEEGDGKSEEAQSCSDCSVVGESLLSADCAMEEHLPCDDCLGNSEAGQGNSEEGQSLETCDNLRKRQRSGLLDLSDPAVEATAKRRCSVETRDDIAVHTSASLGSPRGEELAVRSVSPLPPLPMVHFRSLSPLPPSPEPCTILEVLSPLTPLPLSPPHTLGQTMDITLSPLPPSPPNHSLSADEEEITEQGCAEESTLDSASASQPVSLLPSSPPNHTASTEEEDITEQGSLKESALDPPSASQQVGTTPSPLPSSPLDHTSSVEEGEITDDDEAEERGSAPASANQHMDVTTSPLPPYPPNHNLPVEEGEITDDKVVEERDPVPASASQQMNVTSSPVPPFVLNRIQSSEKGEISDDKKVEKVGFVPAPATSSQPEETLVQDPCLRLSVEVACSEPSTGGVCSRPLGGVGYTQQQWPKRRQPSVVMPLRPVAVPLPPEQRQLVANMQCPLALPSWLVASMARVQCCDEHFQTSRDKKKMNKCKPKQVVVRQHAQRPSDYILVNLERLVCGQLHLSTAITMFSNPRNVPSTQEMVAATITFLRDRYFPRIEHVVSLYHNLCDAIRANAHFQPRDSACPAPLTRTDCQIVALLASVCRTNKHQVQLLPELTKALHQVIVSPGVKFHSLYALCRVFTSVCRLLGDSERVQFLVCDLLCRPLQPNEFPVLVGVASVWPAALGRQPGVPVVEKSQLVPAGVEAQALTYTIEVVAVSVMNRIKKEGRDKDVCHILKNFRTLCSWNCSFPPHTVNQLAKLFINTLQTNTQVFIDSVPPGVLPWRRPRPSLMAFRIVHCLRMLVWLRGWTWTNDTLIGTHLWPLLQKWRGKEEVVREATVVCAIRLIGFVAKQGLAHDANSSSIQKLQQVLLSFLPPSSTPSMTLPVQLATADSLLDLCPAGHPRAPEAVRAVSQCVQALATTPAGPVLAQEYHSRLINYGS